MCNVCHESYPGILVFKQDEEPICVRCRKEHGIHRFSPPFTFERHSKMAKSAYATIRKKEEQQSESISA